MKTTCVKCNTAEVDKISRCGTRPTCEACREASQVRRQGKNELRRALGLNLSHCDRNGNRYRNKSAMRDATCDLCRVTFQTRTKTNRYGVAVCGSCQAAKKEETRKRKLAVVVAIYRRDPERVKRRRLKRTLELMGLGIEWYDAQPKQCGICKTTDSGKRSWCIDHDHRCCPYGPRSGCKKCVRGLLCSGCNAGIGHFKDNPQTLRDAAAWLEAHPLQPS